MGEDSIMMTYIIAGGIFVFCGFVLYHYVSKLRRGESCCSEGEEPIKKVHVADRNKKHYPYEIILFIDGMTCANCALRVENVLNSQPGIYAKVDLGQRKASVLSKEPADVSVLRQRVRDAGYTVLNVKE